LRRKRKAKCNLDEFYGNIGKENKKGEKLR